MMAWVKQTFYNIRYLDYSICEVKVKDVTNYELFFKQQVVKQGFTNMDEAIKYFNGFIKLVENEKII